jgi:hypothetical protein
VAHLIQEHLDNCLNQLGAVMPCEVDHIAFANRPLEALIEEEL